MIWLLAPLAVAALLAAYGVGLRRGGRAWREEQYQREIERRLLGREDPEPASTALPAVVRRPRVARSNLWRD